MFAAQLSEATKELPVPERHQITDAWFTGTRRWIRAQTNQARQYQGRIDGGTFEDYEVAKATANAALRALIQLGQAVDRFADDIFVNKGLWQPDGQQIAKSDRKFGGTPKVWKEKAVDAVKAAREAVSDAKSRVEFLLAGMTPDRGDFRWDARFHADQAGWNLALKSMGISVDDAADAVYDAIDKLLRGLGKVYNMRSGLAPWEPGGGPNVPDVVDVSGAKLVFDPLPDPTRAMRMEPGEGYIEPRVRESYVSELLKAKALLQKRGLGFLWYGTFFAKPKGEAPENHLGAHFGVGANYSPTRDDVRIFVLHRKLHVLIAHELGHRLWFKFLTQAQRAGFESHFGDVKAVSKYGETNAEEDFAEVFAYYIDGRDLTRDQIERFKSFVTGRWKMESLAEELEAAIAESSLNLSKTMEVWLKGVFEDGGSRPIPKKTFAALSARGFVEGGKEVSMLDVGRSGLVTATLTQKGRDTAIALFRKEHQERLANGERSERIPALLKKRGVSVEEMVEADGERGERDRGGQYKHHDRWDRMCKCGHPLSKHSAVALKGGIRDCFGCEEDGRDDSQHKFVEQKKPKAAG